MSEDDIRVLLSQMNENDAGKLLVLLRSFATPDDLAAFIQMTTETHKEQERRRWAWDIVKKAAAAIVLLAGAAAALKNGLSGEWWTGR